MKRTSRFIEYFIISKSSNGLWTNSEIIGRTIESSESNSCIGPSYLHSSFKKISLRWSHWSTVPLKSHIPHPRMGAFRFPSTVTRVPGLISNPLLNSEVNGKIGVREEASLPGWGWTQSIIDSFTDYRIPDRMEVSCNPLLLVHTRMDWEEKLVYAFESHLEEYCNRKEMISITW